ncbi:MAG: CRISPR-associated endonuclease Cas2 [Oscillatoriales cyanobacterium SM2_2_1]|nr:CRISPR-associated endonuclease Cas2 [Oscillatoriales cyanobacterium SM2_2_1]
MLYIVAYDIPCSKRRKKVADLLAGYGQRVQFSVFECVLLPAKYEELKKRLRKRIQIAEDSIRIYPLSTHTLPQVEVWGGPPLTEPEKSKVF